VRLRTIHNQSVILRHQSNYVSLGLWMHTARVNVLLPGG
jgi:hypothetical protein